MHYVLCSKQGYKIDGVVLITIANLSKDVFERRTLTGSGAFFLFICLDAIKFSLQTFFSLLKTIYPRVLTKPLLNDAKSPLPVDVRRSKTLLLKLPHMYFRNFFRNFFLFFVPSLEHGPTTKRNIYLTPLIEIGNLYGILEEIIWTPG